VTKFTPADQYTLRLLSPNKIFWEADGVDCTISGNAEGQILNNWDGGTYQADLEGVKVTATIAVNNEGGQPAFYVQNCKTRITKIRAKLSGIINNNLLFFILKMF